MTSWNQAVFDEHYKNVTGKLPEVYWERSNNKSVTGKPEEYLVPGINWEKRDLDPPKNDVWVYFILYGAIAVVSFFLLLVIYCVYRQCCRKKKAINAKQLPKTKTNLTSPPSTGNIGMNGNGGISNTPATKPSGVSSPSVNKTTVLKTVQPAPRQDQPLIRHHTHSTTVRTPLQRVATTANPQSPPQQQTYEHDPTSTSTIAMAAVVVLIEEVDDDDDNDDDDEQLCRECGYPASFHN